MSDEQLSKPLRTDDLHSAAYFGDQRDYWWNVDAARLMVERAALGPAPRILDVGCGMGHWSRVLLPHLPDATLTGLDREPAWVAEAARRAEKAGLAARTTYRTGDANALPFDDGTFDVVTCQTLLMHVPDPVAVLREFRRVLRAGGKLLVAEPNNTAGALTFGSERHDAPIEDVLALVEFQLRIERGKKLLGEGDNAIADLLPSHLHDAGFIDVKSWLSDRALVLTPPYDTPDQAANVADLRASHARGDWGWRESECRRYVRATGASDEAFEALFTKARAAQAADLAAIEEGRFRAVWAGSHFVFVARKAE